jgi:ferredoxin
LQQSKPLLDASIGNGKDNPVKKPDKYADWSPDPAQMALKPDVSGNEINGLGEHDFRRPDFVYWADGPGITAHWDMQKWFYGANTKPLMTQARVERAKLDDLDIAAKAPNRAAGDASHFTALAKSKAREVGAALVGITTFNKDWLYRGKECNLPRVIVMGIAQDYETMLQAPDDPAAAEVVKQYGTCQSTAKLLANWIHQQGYNALTHFGPMSGLYTMVPAAIAAGLGELGKHGSVINRTLGSNFRLTSVLTDMPLDGDESDIFGADAFCENCQICVNICPPKAIGAEKQWVRGVEKYYVNFDKCLPFFNETAGCGMCMVACPWSRPGVGDNLLNKMARRRRVDA